MPYMPEIKDPAASTPEKERVRGPDTNVIPSISVSERYDSNVYFVPGSQFEDYVTSVSPRLKVVHKDQLIEGTAAGGVTSETYVKNSNLNYVATNAFVDLNLDGAMNYLVRGLGLRLSDTYAYTPQVPAFTPPTTGGQLPQLAVQGIQAQRVHSHSNAAKVEGSYAISQVLSVVSRYTDQRITFGTPIAAPTPGVQTGFADTTLQTLTSGLALKPSLLDTFSLSHQYQKGTFNFGDSPSSYSIQGAIAGWKRSITRTLEMNMTGGVNVFTTNDNVQFVGSASLLWRDQNTNVYLSYTRAIAPSFYIVAVPLLSQVVSAAVTHRVTDPFSVSLMGNYAFNESVPDTSLIKFESYSVTPSLIYKLNRYLSAALSFTHSQYVQTASSQQTNFDRNIVLLNFFAQWE